jgi:hypothetical protein
LIEPACGSVPALSTNSSSPRLRTVSWYRYRPVSPVCEASAYSRCDQVPSGISRSRWRNSSSPASSTRLITVFTASAPYRSISASTLRTVMVLAETAARRSICTTPGSRD